jgi:hypothetical protein
MQLQNQQECFNMHKSGNKKDSLYITGKTQLLLESLIEYYSKNIDTLSSIVTQKSVLSLRILDWLVTNYAKKHNVVYTVRTKNGDINFNVYIEYKNQLKAYSKKHFDPFCRRDRILINTKNLKWSLYENTSIKNSPNELITTVGQLNFFKWFIENNVLTYAVENIQIIDKDMSETLKNSKDKDTKRKELSKSASKSICSYSRNIIVNF